MVAEFDPASGALPPLPGISAELKGRPDGERDDEDRARARKEAEAAKAFADELEKKMQQRREHAAKIRSDEAEAEARRAAAARQELADVDEFLGALAVVANAAVSRGDLVMIGQIATRAERVATRARESTEVVDSHIVSTTLPAEEASVGRRADLGAIAHSVASRVRALGGLVESAARNAHDSAALETAVESRDRLHVEADAIETTARPGPEDLVHLARKKASPGAVFNEEA